MKKKTQLRDRVKKIQLRNREENLICGGGEKGTRVCICKTVFVGTFSVQHKL